MENFEKLGAFYLGRLFNMEANKTTGDLLLYDSKDLVTHAVCVGMTGSGKTGLCISLIEEAAIDGIPSILIDPKGDLTNLLLTFPDLTTNEFLPWINLDDARQKGLDPQSFASKQAETWKKGLAEWGQDGSRIRKLKDSVEMMVYTPGSNAGIPVSILQSFASPPKAILDDSDLLHERINTTVTSLLGLIGIEADPVKSREHILLSTILAHTWQQGKDLDLAAIIQAVQDPPVTKIGVLDLESFFSSNERFALVQALNNLLASHGFTTWLQGVPLDIGQILYTPAGRPRIAIFSIAHLSDPERMFFVSLLMNQVLGWTRSQSGTTSLRAIVYMDEIFGFLPPISNPPSKLPMITMLKQARAFGVGMILATQNPVDLDYKALGNAGTWFIGRLQTDRDKMRLLDGLGIAADSYGARFDRSAMENTLSRLGNRVFLMNNTHEDAPVIFQTRWALSYLRGPLTRDQIKILMDPIKDTTHPVSPLSSTGGLEPTRVPLAQTRDQPAALPPEITAYYLPIRGAVSPETSLVYLPALLGAARVNFSDSKMNLSFSENAVFTTQITDKPIPVDWETAHELTVPPADLEKDPQPNAQYTPLPTSAAQVKNYDDWQRADSTWLYGTRKLDLWLSPSLKEVSRPGETEQDFRVRLAQNARERRDEAVETLRKKYASKEQVLQDRLLRATQAEEKQKEQAKQAKVQTAISIGSTLLGALTGRKLSSTTISRASTAVRGASRAIDEGKDVARAGETKESIQKQILDLNAQFVKEAEILQQKIDPATETMEHLSVKPRKTDIIMQLFSLVWMPHWKDGKGNLSAAW